MNNVCESMSTKQNSRTHYNNNLVDTGGKLNVHKTFRGRLLNVLCTFNLRLVSARKSHADNTR